MCFTIGDLRSFYKVLLLLVWFDLMFKCIERMVTLLSDWFELAKTDSTKRYANVFSELCIYYVAVELLNIVIFRFFLFIWNAIPNKCDNQQRTILFWMITMHLMRKEYSIWISAYLSMILLCVFELIHELCLHASGLNIFRFTTLTTWNCWLIFWLSTVI